jgi:hypothetical protein
MRSISDARWHSFALPPPKTRAAHFSKGTTAWIGDREADQNHCAIRTGEQGADEQER